MPPSPLSLGIAGPEWNRGRHCAGQLGQLGLGLVNKGNSGAKIEGALRTIEEMHLESLARIGRQLIEEVTLGGHLLYRFAVIHLSISTTVLQ
jgi:hypothetical protein